MQTGTPRAITTIPEPVTQIAAGYVTLLLLSQLSVAVCPHWLPFVYQRPARTRIDSEWRSVCLGPEPRGSVRLQTTTEREKGRADCCPKAYGRPAASLLLHCRGPYSEHDHQQIRECLQRASRPPLFPLTVDTLLSKCCRVTSWPVDRCSGSTRLRSPRCSRLCSSSPLASPRQTAAPLRHVSLCMPRVHLACCLLSLELEHCEWKATSCVQQRIVTWC